jgi:glucose/mannose-6-phosphate isomerase
MDYLKFPEDYLSFDTEDILSQYRSLAQDIKKAFDMGEQWSFQPLKAPIDQLVFIGVGGSAISFDFLKAYLINLGINKPIFVVRDYNVPNTVTANSLVFVASYSGETEETLSAYKTAFRITQNIFTVSSGGKLEEICNLNKTPFLQVPKGYQPRTAALSYLFFPFLKALEKLRVLPPQDNSVIQIMNTVLKPNFKDLAISISEKLVDKIPLIYSSNLMYPVAYRLKTAINENAKVHAFSHAYSELNHNELMGFTNLKASYHIITFRFNHDHRRIQKRMDAMKDITNTKGVATTEIALSGEDFLTKLISAVYVGDLIAIYLALRYKTDPSPVLLVEEFKKKIGPVIF